MAVLNLIGKLRGCRTGALRLLIAPLALGMIAMACTPPPATGVSPNDAPRAGDAAYAEHGPFEVGVTTVELSDRKMEVWYPVDPTGSDAGPRDAYYIRDFLGSGFKDLIDPSVNPPYVTDAVRGLPVSTEGPFPLVLFAHGFASFRLQSSFLTTHLASWGFVVISPEFLDRGLKAVLGEPPPVAKSDLKVADEAIRQIRSMNTTPGGMFAGKVDTSKVFPVGHSAGGGTAVALLQRPDVPSAIPLAAGYFISAGIYGSWLPTLDKPIEWIGAQNDGIVPIDDLRNGFAMTAGPSRLVEIGHSGHLNAFSDICEIGDGGIVSLARAASLPVPEFLLQLGNDGCPVPPNKKSTEVWPEVRHFVTAELRFRSGLDKQPVGLGDQVLAQFDDVVSYKHNP